MLRQRRNKESDGQTLLEYAIVLTLVGAVIFTMAPVIRRGLQSMIKGVADQVGVQNESDQDFDETGHLVETYTLTRTSQQDDLIEFLGVTNTLMDHVTVITTNTVLNLGFSEEPEDN